MKNTLLSLFTIFTSTVFCIGQNELPFEVHSSSYKLFKNAIEKFDLQEYSEAADLYEESNEILELFPFEQYKYALSLWLIEDTIKARKVFYQAIKNGLDFKSPLFISGCPMLKELSFNETVYAMAIATTMDATCIFKEVQDRLLALKVFDQGVRHGEFEGQYTMRQIDSLTPAGLRPILNEIG